MNNIEKMNNLMKIYFGSVVPTLYYKNHERIRFRYDSDKNVLCTECGVELDVNLSESEFKKSELRKLIHQLDDAVIAFYKKKNIYLIHNDD